MASYLQRVHAIMTDGKGKAIPMVLHVCRFHALRFIGRKIETFYQTKDKKNKEKQEIANVLNKWMKLFLVILPKAVALRHLID